MIGFNNSFDCERVMGEKREGGRVFRSGEGGKGGEYRFVIKDMSLGGKGKFGSGEKNRKNR